MTELRSDAHGPSDGGTLGPGARGRLASTLGVAGALLASRLGRRQVPVQASIYLTDRCNLRCVYCGLPGLRTPELPTAAWVSIIEQLAGLGCRRLTFIGGEPLMRRDLRELIDAGVGNGMACTVSSNGLLVSDRRDDLRRLETLVLSLDAPSPANDAARGVGSLAAVEQATAVAAAMGIAVTINAVLSRVTVGEIGRLLDFAEQRSVRLTVSIMRFGDPGLWREAGRIRLADQGIRQALRRLADEANVRRSLSISPHSYRFAASWPDYGRDRVTAREMADEAFRRLRPPRCQAGRRYVSFDPSGRAFPCSVTRRQVTERSAAEVGVERVWRDVAGHDCVACFSPCLVDVNSLYSLAPRALSDFVRRRLFTDSGGRHTRRVASREGS